MSLLRNLVSGTERRDFNGPWGPFADGRIPPPGLDGISSTGAIVNERTAMQIIDVYACVSLRADSVSMLPGKAYRKAGDIRSDVNPQPSIIAQPDPEMEPGQFWARMETSLLL